MSVFQGNYIKKIENPYFTTYLSIIYRMELKIVQCGM